MIEGAEAANAGMLGLAKDRAQFIDGRFVSGAGRSFTVFDPSYGCEVAHVAGASLDQVEQMILTAKTAQPAWEALPRMDRTAKLRRFIIEMRARLDDLRSVLVAEAGCPAGPAPSAAGILYFQTIAGLDQANDALDLYLTLPDVEEYPLPVGQRVNAYGQFAQSLARYTAVGVVAAIAAYNYPFYTAIWKVLPALATGNTVILRPSPLTPISSLIFAQAAVAAGLPDGVLSVLTEEGIEGAHLLTTHKDVGMVAFTGSSGVGVRVMEQAAATMKRLQLELGGKSAQIFLPDAVDKAAAGAAGVCLAHAGQGCVLGTRIFVPQERKDEVLAAMKAALANVAIGPADDDATVLGPLISEAQVQRCEHFVQLAVQAGAKVVCGGKRPSGLPGGFFFEPTIIDVPDNRNPAAQDEIFGPVVCVIGYRDMDHAVEMANDTVFGLSGYVFGEDRRAALDVAMRLKTGAVNVNGGVNSAYASMGGMRMSGVGRERGVEGLRLYQNMSNLNLVG